MRPGFIYVECPKCGQGIRLDGIKPWHVGSLPTQRIPNIRCPRGSCGRVLHIDLTVDTVLGLVSENA
jgi:hypothetical protein